MEVCTDLKKRSDYDVIHVFGCSVESIPIKGLLITLKAFVYGLIKSNFLI